jgi:hypothetical protein
LKCLNVMARPATIAGRYNRSRQFSFGRGTVMAMFNLSLPLRLLLTIFACVFGDPAAQLIQHCEQHSYDLFQDRFA